MRDSFRIKPVTRGDFLYNYVICNMSIKESRKRYQYTHFNIVNWYRNRSSITTYSYILLSEHCRRFNSTVSNLVNNRIFWRILRWFWRYLFHMQYQHEGVEIALSLQEFQTLPIDSGIDQPKPHHRKSRCLDTAGDWIRQYQIMLNNRTICRIAAYGTHCT